MLVMDLLLSIDFDTLITIFSMNDHDIVGTGFVSDLSQLIGANSIVHNIYTKDNSIWIDIWE